MVTEHRFNHNLDWQIDVAKILQIVFIFLLIVMGYMNWQQAKEFTQAVNRLDELQQLEMNSHLCARYCSSIETDMPLNYRYDPTDQTCECFQPGEQVLERTSIGKIRAELMP